MTHLSLTRLPGSSSSGDGAAMTTGALMVVIGVLLMVGCYIYLRGRRRRHTGALFAAREASPGGRFAAEHGLSFVGTARIVPSEPMSTAIADALEGSWKGLPVRAGRVATPESETWVAACNLGRTLDPDTTAALQQTHAGWSIAAQETWLVVSAPQLDEARLGELLDTLVELALTAPEIIPRV